MKKIKNEESGVKLHYSVVAPMLDGWVQVPDPMKSYHNENAKKFALYINGKEVCTAQSSDFGSKCRASLSYDMDKLYCYEFDSMELAMAAAEEIVKFWSDFKQKWDAKA